MPKKFLIILIATLLVKEAAFAESFSVGTSVNVPSTPINQLSQEIEGIKEKLTEIEKVKTEENKNWKFFILFLSIGVLIIALYFNRKISDFSKFFENQKKVQEIKANSLKNEPVKLMDEDIIEEFIQNVLGLAAKIPQNQINEPIITQLVKVVTSIGAGLIWARNPESRKDYQYKINICQKKIKETQYWLKLISFIAPELKKEVKDLIEQSQEIENFLKFIK